MPEKNDRNLASAHNDIVDRRENIYPLPPGCSRFILPVTMCRALEEHPLAQDVYPTAAGSYQLDTRRFACPPQSEFLIYYCTGGAMTLRTAEGEWPVGSGDLVLIPPGMTYVTDASPSAPWTFYWVMYAGMQSTAISEFLGLDRLTVHVGLQPELIAEFEAICTLRTSDFALDTFIHGANRLKALLTGFALALARKGQRKRGRIDLERVRRFMAERLDRPLTLEELAEVANLSRYHFARTFKRVTGQSPMHYFVQMRIQQACYLLDTTRESIKQIAFAVGYADPLYFSQLFRRIIGVSPQGYRQWSASTSR